MNDDIIERIRALRAKVNNAASTQAEVEAAARLVSKLMIRHGVVEEQLVERKAGHNSVHAMTEPMKAGIDSVMTRCWEALEAFTETKVYVDDKQRFNFIGLDFDVETALYLFELITMSAKRGWYKHSAKMFDEDGATNTKYARDSFYIGFGIQIGKMLDDLKEERRGARAGMTGTHIVVFKKDAITEKMREMGISLRKSRARRVSIDSSDAFLSGQNRAKEVNLTTAGVTPTERVKGAQDNRVTNTKRIGRV